MALNKRAKAPKYPQEQPKGGHARSSMKKPKPLGIQPGKTAYGILNTSRGDQDSLGARAGKLFGTGSGNTSNQGQLARKAKRQVG